MRKALNENRTVQIVLLGGLAVLVAFMLMRMGGDESTPTTPAQPGATSTNGATGAGVPGTGADASATGATAGSATAPAPDAAAAGATAGVVPPAATVTPEALKPGPGLPADLANAWKSGDAVVLLIVKPSAVDDKAVRSSVSSLSGGSGVSVFIVPANRIARYSRITQSVGVNRVPALIVIRPKRLSGAIPQALVSYGFRGPQSVNQALDDALYSGKDNVPYYPH